MGLFDGVMVEVGHVACAQARQHDPLPMVTTRETARTCGPISIAPSQALTRSRPQQGHPLGATPNDRPFRHLIPPPLTDRNAKRPHPFLGLLFGAKRKSAKRPTPPTKSKMSQLRNALSSARQTRGATAPMPTTAAPPNSMPPSYPASRRDCRGTSTRRSRNRSPAMKHGRSAYKPRARGRRRPA
jgi:hypothetical protein